MYKCIFMYRTLTGIMLIYDDFHHLIRRKTTDQYIDGNSLIFLSVA